MPYPNPLFVVPGLLFADDAVATTPSLDSLERMLDHLSEWARGPPLVALSRLVGSPLALWTCGTILEQ